MLKQLWHKIKEALISVMPVTLIVLILNFTPFINLSIREVIVFSVCALCLVFGIGLFSLGADLAMQPMGEKVGSGLIKTKKIWLILLVAFMMGLLITIAEPDLSVLAEQMKAIPKPLLIGAVGVGVGIFLSIAMLKIIFKLDLSSIIIYFYFALFALAALLFALNKGALFPLSFDSGGVTTGPITVPFIMALGVGVAATVGGRNKKENSFGLIALCSVGPIIAIIILSSTVSNNHIKDFLIDTDSYKISSNLLHDVFHNLKDVSLEVLLAIGLIVAFFFILNIFFIKLPKNNIYRILIGILYTFIGLVIFLTAVGIGFMPVGYKIGDQLAQRPITLVIFAFVLGMVVVLAEPAVNVLTKQVEEITTGGISRKAMLIALSIGVGISICLSVVRIIFGFSLLYYVIPGYIICLGLSFFVPKMYTAIAFDSGGVASGPLTSSFILPLAIGACYALHKNALPNQAVLDFAYGIVAMVAMTPLITIQLLGFKDVITKKVRVRNRTKKILDADDEQIINFM